MPMRAAKCPRDIRLASSTGRLLLLGLLHPHTLPSLPTPQGSNRAPAVSTEVTPLVAFSASLANHRYSRPSVTAIYLGPSPRQRHGPLSRSRAEQRSAAELSRSAGGCTPICAPPTVSEPSVVIALALALALASSPRVCVQWFGWGGERV
jgi:hypothetical protein